VQVTVRYTGYLQVALDTLEEQVNLPGDESCLGELLQALETLHGSAVMGKLRRSYMAVIDGAGGTRSVRLDRTAAPLFEGDTVSLIRPFAGG